MVTLIAIFSKNGGCKTIDHEDEIKDGISPLQTKFPKPQVEKPKKKGR